jgi:hypothetical protein
MEENSVLHVLFYESGERAELAPLHFPAHRERWTAFAEGDPFVVDSVVGRWYVREWLEALVGECR